MAIECSLAVTPSRESVAFALTVANGGLDPVELVFPDAGRADFAVRAGDTEMWRWSAGRMVTQAIETVTLAPGERITVEATWTDPTPDDYTVVAELQAREHHCEARTEFSV